jgi:hypothetical protein
MRWTIRCRGFDLGIFRSEEDARLYARVHFLHDRWEVVST